MTGGGYVYDSEKVTSICRRCEKPFSYIQKTKPRFYCPTCKEIEKKESLKLSNEKHYREVRKPQREADKLRWGKT